jgi:dihydropteroate synthase
MKYKFGNIEYDLSSRTFIMGILNITPDSFSDGGKYFDGKVLLKKVVKDAKMMERDGADFIDVGGESTRPGSDEISIEEELERVIPVISELKKHIKIPISIDTYKNRVAEEAFKNGAAIVNDISGFKFDYMLPEITKKYNASCILMHIQGTPKKMQINPQYENVVEGVYEYLSDSIKIAREYKIEQLIIDPGIGFGKILSDNLSLIRNLSKFKSFGLPIIIGLSNKKFIDNISPTLVNERLEGTIASNTFAILNGANILRVHNVLSNRKAAIITDKLKEFNGNTG